MADLKSPVNPLFLREEELNRGIEMLYFGYRDFIAEADAVLLPLGLGRAHHRVIYFVGRHPEIAVAALLAILRITKQSLSRVLGQLVRGGYVAQVKGRRDRRQRLLSLTDKGRELERRLSGLQRRRVGGAYRKAGADAVEGFRKVMLGLMTAADRKRFEAGGR